MDFPDPQPSNLRAATPGPPTVPAHSTPVRGYRHGPISMAQSMSTASLSQSQALHKLWTPILRPDFAEVIQNDLKDNLEVVPPADLIKFLFSFCCAKDDQAEVCFDKFHLQGAFLMVRDMVNNDPLLKRKFAELPQTPAEEKEMYLPFSRACNYALQCLARLNCPGLPSLPEDENIIMVVTDSGSPSLEHDHQAQHYGYKPDICITSLSCVRDLVQLNKGEDALHTFGNSDEIQQRFKTSRLYWRNILCPIEVKKKSEDQPPDRSYTAAFSDLPCMNLSPGLESKPSRKYKLVHEVAASRIMKNKSVPGGRQALSSSSVRTKRGIGSKGKQAQRGLPKKPKVNNTEKPQDSQEKAGDIRREGRIQLASYAAHRMSSAFDVTHTVGMLLIGHNVSISWFDRQGAIQSHFFNIYHNLPHFLLLLLTLQRFSLGRWGYAGSVDKFALQVSATHATTSDGNDPPVIASLKVPNKDIFYFQPQGDVIHAGTSLVGRGPWVIGGSKTKVLSNVASLPYHLKEQVHPYVLKLSWPEESRTSEVAILEKVAEKCLKESDIAMFIRGHVPTVETHVDPTFPGSNTGTIRRFLIENYNGSGTRQQRLIVFERLRPLSVLPELQMVQGYIDTFLCHRALWSLGVHHCDISAGNLMWHPRHNVGVMNDFDLSKLTADLNSASGRENTGTLPFMALDLITPDGLNGKIKRRYRHDTEAFAWSLTYICLNYTLDASENIVINTEHPLAGWFSNVHVVTMSKLQLFRPEGQPQWDAINALAYPNAKSLAQDIAGGYVKRYHQQYSVTQNVASSSNWGAMDRDDELSALLDSESNDALRVPQAVPYTELADGIYFRADLKKIRDWLGGQIRDDVRFGDLRTRYFDDTTRRRGMVLLCRD